MQSSRHAPSSSASTQRKAARIPSGHHLSRLKPVEIDPLSEYGLPSKGEKRLLSHKVQESYYSKIAERYLAFCTDAGDRDGLQKQFARLDINKNNNNNNNKTTFDPSSPPPPPLLPSPASGASNTIPPTELPSLSASSSDISLILSALRKLREAIVASKRRDAFAAQVYLFAIRCGILASSYEHYYPALLYLLGGIHPVHGLTSVELHEIVSYLVLDTACRRGDLASAYALRNKHRLRDAKVDGVLRALAADNWCVWRRVKRGVDGYRARIMDFAEADVRGQTLRALGRAYLTVPLAYLEGATGESWDALRDKYKVGWELTADGKVIIRRVQAKTG